jgi:hypothetical protein
MDLGRRRGGSLISKKLKLKFMERRTEMDEVRLTSKVKKAG